jgi:hypothetical protein
LGAALCERPLEQRRTSGGNGGVDGSTRSALGMSDPRRVARRVWLPGLAPLASTRFDPIRFPGVPFGAYVRMGIGVSRMERQTMSGGSVPLLSQGMNVRQQFWYKERFLT